MSLDTSIPPQLSALASISAIAQRIQEKADALNSERNVLQDLQNQLQTLTQQQALQSSKNEALKYDLLKQTRSKIGLEIEIMRRDDRMRELKRKTTEAQAEGGIQTNFKDFTPVETDGNSGPAGNTLREQLCTDPRKQRMATDADTHPTLPTNSARHL